MHRNVQPVQHMLCPMAGRMTRRSAARTALLLGAIFPLFLAAIGSASARGDSPIPVAGGGGDGKDFYQKLQRVTHFRNLRGLNVPAGVIQDLGRGDADRAVATLEALAKQGSRDANVALVRVQHWCGRLASVRPTDLDTQIGKMTETLPPARATRTAQVIRAEHEFRRHAGQACSRAVFDYRQIEARLREAADLGDAASATELAQFVRDPAQRQALLKTAMDKGYAPAYYAIATQLLIAVQRGETTENVGSIREWLKQAGRAVPKAKLDLANCMALGCDGHPADALAARAFGTDAARDGESTAYLSMVRMPWGGRMSRSQLLAWQYFGDRLNEAGCMGDSYASTSTMFAQTIGMLEKGQKPEVLQAARSHADDLWNDFGARAMRENGCD